MLGLIKPHIRKYIQIVNTIMIYITEYMIDVYNFCCCIIKLFSYHFHLQFYVHNNKIISRQTHSNSVINFNLDFPLSLLPVISLSRFRPSFLSLPFLLLSFRHDFSVLTPSTSCSLLYCVLFLFYFSIPSSPFSHSFS